MANEQSKPRGRPRTKPAKSSVDFPNVSPPSLSQRNRSAPPATLRVCGNTIPVINGKAQEADSKVLAERRRAAAKRRGEKKDETRI